MPNNYDEVVEQNRKNLTKAQIAALAKAAQEYGIMNAGNRAGALASLRDQYNAGYRGLQNMGLAGGMEAQARSGEVPRLGAQLQTPFDQYNRKLMEVENKQLSALGTAFAESTKKARAAAAKAKAEAEAAAAAWAAKQKRTAEYEDPRMVYGPKGDKRVTFDKQDADLSAALAVAEIDPRMAKFQNPNFQTAKAGYAGAAGYTSAIMQKQRADAFNERRYAEYEDPRLSNPNFLAERRKERSAALAAAEIDPRTAMFQDPNFQTAKAGYAGSMRRYQAANQDPAVVARKNYEAKDAVVKNMFRAKRAGEVSDDEYRAAVVDRDIAKMHMERPDIPIFSEIDHEAAGANLERARSDYDSVRNASSWKPQPSVDEMHARYHVEYDHYKGLLHVLDDPDASKADKDRARASIESGPMTVDQARNFVEKYENYSPAEEPEDVRRARANAEMADLAYNHPDVYKALYYKHVMTPEMRAKYPEIAAWVDDTIARYNMESLGIKVPTMTRPEYEHAEANAEDIMGLLNEYDAYDNRKGKEAERDAAADLLMKRYHMTVDQAWDFIDNMRNQRDVWSEYDYYYAGARAQVEHNGEKPTQPVNEGENDVTYRAVNGLSRTAGYDVSLTGVHGDDGHMAEFMTPEQRDAYNAIYEKDGIAAANEYYKAITPYLNIQRAAEDEEYYKKFAREHPFFADVRSVGANLLWNIPAAAENIGTGVVGMFTKDRPYYDVSSDFSFRSGRADAIRGQRSFDILNDMSNPEPVRQMQNFAYNTGMSIADSAAIMGLAYLGAPEWVTSLFFGSSAGNQAYKDARARGATQDQALALGIANGIFEALFEEVSLDKVMNMDHTGRAALIKNLLTQMFVEGSEEAFTGIADTLADVLIMGDKSEYKQNIAKYVAAGKSQNEAEWLAFLDQVKETGMDALGGMVSGGVFALGGAAIHDVRAVNHGNMMLEDRGLNDRVTRMAELFGGKALEMLEKYQADPNVRNAGNLYMVVNETMNELFGRTEKPDVDKITPVDESAIIDRATAASALLSGDRMSVMTAENIIGVLGKKYLSAKGMNVSSPAAFANDYNARLAKYGIKSYGETVAKSFKFKTDTLEGFRNRKADQAYRAANPSYAGGSITGKALESRMANRQRVETAAVLNTAESNAAARVWKNPNMGYTTNADGSRFMNMPGNMTAVAMAEYSRKSFKAQTTANMDGVTLELAGMEARKGLTDAQVFAEAKKAMTKEAAQKLDVFMKLAKSLSMPMVIRDVVAGTSGYVHDGKLYVTLSGQQSIPKVVAHELTHFMKDHALQKYNALRTHLIAEVGNTKFNELLQEKAKSYGLDLDTEAGRIEADDEVCAELCERMLSNPDSLERFVERNTDAAITLKDRLLKLLNAIKAALKDPANRNFGRSHSDLIKQEQTVEAWLDGISEAIKNANERAKTTEGRIAQVAGVTTSDQESLIRDIKKASETASKAKQEAAAPVRTAENATTESKTTEKTTAETEPVKAATEADTESKKPAEAAKPAAKPRRYVRVNSTVSDRQGTTFEGGRAPRGMTDLTYKIQNATNFGSGLVTGSMSDYASFGYTSYFGNLDGDAYGYSKSTWRNAGGRAIRDSQAAVSSASDLKQGNAFVNDVLQYNFLSSEELGKANSMTEAEIADRDAAEVDVASVLSADQIAAASTVADMLAKGSEVVIQLPVTDNFDQLARATLKAVFEAMPANKRTGISFATGLTGADISRKGGDVSLIITDKSQQQTGDGKQWTDLSRDSAADAAFDADVDQAFANHLIDIMEYDMAGYHHDLVSSGIMEADEIENLFDTIREAIGKIKLHREILDFGSELNGEAEILAAKEGRAYLPYKQNADPHYKLALDFSTLCRKRVLLGSIQEMLQKKLKRSLSPAETIAIRRELLKLKADGAQIEVACALCYVEAARLKSHKVIDEFLGIGLNQAERTNHTADEMRNYYAQNVSDLRNAVKDEQDKWKRDTISDAWWMKHGNKDKKTGNLKDKASATKAQIEEYGKSIGKVGLKKEFEAFSKQKRTESKVSSDQQLMIRHAQDLVNDKTVTINGVEFPGVETFLSSEWLAKLKMAAPDIFYAFTNKVRSATRSKAQETDTFYSRGDISMVTDAVLRYANAESGFRHQSWSDFVPTHLMDTIAAVIEMSTRKYTDENGKEQTGAKMHAYTKVAAMVELLGKTGMMLNMSLIPDGTTGIDKDGNLIWDSYEGMNYDTMLYLRDMFPNTAGNIAIGISDAQIMKLLQSDDIDYVIPYHASGLNQQMRGHMGLMGWLEYTSSQNEKEVDDEAVKERHKENKQKPPALRDWFEEDKAKAAGANGYAYMREAAQKYLDICKKDGWIPKFSQYIEEKDGRYVPKEGYENYWKLLIDRKMVNHQTGEVIIQQAVKPIFDQATVMRILDDAVGDPANQAKEQAVNTVYNKLSNEWVAEKENANLEDKAEKKRFNEITAVLAAARAKEDVLNRRRIQELREQNGVTRNSIDEEFVDTVNKTASTTRYTADTESERLPAYKPQGKAPRVREVRVPERAKNGDRVSDFVRSFLESDKASDEIVAELQDKIENGEWGSYTQLSNEEAMDRAKGYIARKQFTESQSDFHDMVASGKYNVHTRALGLQLLTEAANRGDKASVLDIAADLRQLATDAGQSLQIFSVLKELSGVGAAWYMQKEIDRLNNQYAEEITAGKMNEITVAPELMQKLLQASTQAEVEAAEDAIAEQVADQLPLTWKSRITNWRYLSMLGNPTTHFRNLTGNVFMAGMNAVKDVVATGIERVAVKPEDRAHAVLTRADRNTWKDFASASFQEQEKNLRGSGKNGFGSFIQQHMRAFDTKWLNAISQGSKTGKNVLTKNGVMGMLEVEDTWFLKPAYQNALMQYMKAQGYTLQDGVAGKVVNGKFTEITTAQMSKAIDWASQQAWKATFRDASALASLLNKASNLNPVAHVLVEGIMPFKKTPVNIAKRGIEYSPIGVVMGAVQMVRDVRKGKMTAAQAIDNIASGVVGTSLMVIGMFMAKAGLLRAGGDDDKKKSTYMLDTGDQTYSLKFGNVSIGISALSPAAIPLLMGAALWDAMNRDGEDEWDISAITETIAGTLDPFMEMSVVSSLNSALKNYNKNGIGGALGNTILTALQSYGGQMLPTFVGKVGQYIDPITRTTKSSAASPIGGTWDYYGRSLMKKIPGVEALLEPDVNVWGRTTKKSGFGAWALDFANRFILPVNVKIANRDAVDDELIRLVESTGNISILPSDGDKYFTVDGKKYPMTAAQYTEYSKDRGQASYAALKEVMNSPAYQKATDAERADMLSNALKMAQKHVNTVWKEKLGALDTAKAPANTEEPAKPTGVKDIQGDYSDPALYQIAAKYPNAYDKAAKAKSRGIDPTTFLELYEKMDTYIGEYRGSYMRSEIMASNLTPEQKELMDDLLVSDKGRNPDYSSPTWFEVSMLGKSAYDEAKAGEKIGLKPEIYLEAYTKRKEIDAAKLGKDRKPTILRYLDSLNVSAPVYDYLLLAVFGIKSR